ncbi:MAG: PKD domain-containing protein [Oligoflexia bacterium]|nr:PKD domain-containing protein [Oligoflexia bacterium]
MNLVLEVVSITTTTITTKKLTTYILLNLLLLSFVSFIGCAPKSPKPPISIFDTTVVNDKYAPATLSFNGSTSNDPDGVITNYSWNFGDGSAEISGGDKAIVSHTFNTNGAFTVSLKVTDDGGHHTTLNKSVEILNGFPDTKLEMHLSLPALVVPNDITFDASQTTTRFPGATIVKYKWDIGGGNIIENTESAMLKSYTVPGTYRVKVTAVDSSNRESSKELTFTLTDGSPNAQFSLSLSINKNYAPATANLDASASAPVFPGSTIAKYIWNFGDGSSNVETQSKIISHNYLNAGTYKISLTVVDSDDRKSTREQTLTLTEGNPICAFSVDSPFSEVVVNKNVTLNAANSRVEYPGATLSNYEFTIGTTKLTSSTNTKTYAFTSTGNFTVTLKITDSMGKSSQCTQNVIVTNGTPKANFTYSPTSDLRIPVTVSFDASSSQDPDGSISLYKWNFGDGTIQDTTTKQITHQYRSVGNFNVTLTVVDNGGLQASKSVNLNVQQALPVQITDIFTGIANAQNSVNITPLTAESGNISVKLKRNTTATTATTATSGLNNSTLVSSGSTINRFIVRSTWGDDDNPSLFNNNLNFTLALLPLVGEATKIPWPGSYWPTYQDSINVRWNGSTTPSAVEKYEQAFNKVGIQNLVSQEYGIDAQTEAATCNSDTDCNSSKGEACAKKRGASVGRCIPTWFGVCHAWAPAAIMEKEPIRPVSINGVEFKVNDLKALLTYGYNSGLKTKFISLRCNLDDSNITYDEYGNPTNPECKDTNAGTFHVIATNYLGILKESFVEDRTFDDEVWNQPVRGYQISLQEQVSASVANQLLGVSGSTYNFNLQAVSLYHVKMRFFYIGESNSNVDGNLAATIDSYTNGDDYEYILELDSVGKIVGGEWIGTSKKKHPDFLWLPYEKTPTVVSGINWNDVKYMGEKSTMILGSTTVNDTNNISGGYIRYYGPYNTIANGKIKVVLTPTSGDSDLYVKVDAQPTTSSYNCRPYKEGLAMEVCELSGPGNFYVGVYGYESSNDYKLSIQYDTEDKIESQSNSFTLANGEWKHFGPFDNIADGEKFLVLMQLTSGDADLYVKNGSTPTYYNYDCRPGYTELDSEFCSLTGPGPIYVSLLGKEGGTAGKLFMDFTRAQNLNAYLFVRKGGAPSETQYDCKQRFVESSGVAQCDLSGPGQIFMMIKNEYKEIFNYKVEATYMKIPQI